MQSVLWRTRFDVDIAVQRCSFALAGPVCRVSLSSRETQVFSSQALRIEEILLQLTDRHGNPTDKDAAGRGKKALKLHLSHLS